MTLVYSKMSLHISSDQNQKYLLATGARLNFTHMSERKISFKNVTLKINVTIRKEET